jgi:hypothetical protein
MSATSRSGKIGVAASVQEKIRRIGTHITRAKRPRGFTKFLTPRLEPSAKRPRQDER